MKRITILLVVLLTLTSCGEELVFNDPAFRGYNGEALWEATTYRANVDTSGNLIITGIRNLETINLKTINASEGLYELGNTVSSATYENQSGTVYSTNSIPSPSIQLYPSEGNIEITEFNVIEKTVSGTFYFHAFDNSGLDSENFNRGYFHNVPILSIGNTATTGQTVACQNASAVVVTTKTNLDNVDPAGPQYTPFCNEYKTALQVKKQECGDDDGSIQALVNGLGDCSN